MTSLNQNRGPELSLCLKKPQHLNVLLERILWPCLTQGLCPCIAELYIWREINHSLACCISQEGPCSRGH